MADLVLQTYLSLIQTSRSDSPNNRMGSALSRSLRITYQNTSSIWIPDICTAWTQALCPGSFIKKVEISLGMRLSGPQTLLAMRGRSSGRERKGLLVMQGRGWGITLLGSVELEWHNFLILQTSFSDLQLRYYSNFQNFYVLYTVSCH